MEYATADPRARAIAIAAAALLLGYWALLVYGAHLWLPDPPALGMMSLDEAREATVAYNRSLSARLFWLGLPAPAVLASIGVLALRSGLRTLCAGQFPPPGEPSAFSQPVHRGRVAVRLGVAKASVGILSLVAAAWFLVELTGAWRLLRAT